MILEIDRVEIYPQRRIEDPDNGSIYDEFFFCENS